MQKTSRQRSLVKAITWESISTFITIGVAYLFTSCITSSISLSITCLVVKVIFYYYHERLWIKSTWGKNDNT